MVASTLLVQADLSGTTYAGTFNPTDITRFVRLADGIGITNWRQDALAEMPASTFSLTLDNEALPGDATAPNAGRFTPGLSTSPWSGRLLPGVRVRVTETVGGTPFQLADGYVLDWTTQPGQDDGTFPVTVINCVDILGWMGTLQPLYSIVVEEMLLDAPASLYPLEEAAGATSASDLTGKQALATVTRAKGGVSTSTFAFGAAVPYVDIPSGLKLTSPDAGQASSFAHCYYLNVPSTLTPAGTGWTIVVAFVGPTSNAASVFDEYIWSIGAPNDFDGTATLVIPAGTGIPSFTCTNGTSIGANGTFNVCDGKPHVISCSLSADGKTATMVVDGTVFSNSAGSSKGPITQQPITVGCKVFAGGNAGYPFAGTFNLIAQYSGVLPTARSAAYYTAAVTAFAGEDTTTHVTRLLSYRPNLGSVLGSGRGTMGPHKTSGLTLQRALLDTAKAEGGVIFANGAGQMVFFSRGRLFDPATTATFDTEADVTAAGYQARIDMQQLVNDMTVSWPSGSDQRVVDATSAATYGPRQSSDTYVINSARDAKDGAGWLVANQKNAQMRTPNITADITTMASTAQAQAVLGRNPLDRVGLSNLPAWAPPTDVAVQGRTVHITDTEFTVSFFTSPLSRKTLRADAAASANTKLDNGLVIPW